MNERYWGVDLGGTKIEAAITDETMRPLFRKRISTEADGGYEHIVRRIAALLESLAAESALDIPAVVGIGTPGRYEADHRRIRNSNTVVLNGRDLKGDLEKLLQREFRMENDANCFALAESLLGAGREIMHAGEGRTSFCMIMGTGVGGGIVCGKGVMHGAHGIAGEWGHNVLIPDGEQCYCGKRGCVETVLSGPALERYYTRLSGSVRPLRDIAGSARTDPAAEQTVKHLVQNFARAIAPVLNILDPHCCIIGGGVGNIGDLYSRETMRLIEADLFGGGLSVPFLRPKLGDSAGVFGAALLVARPLHAR